MRLLLKILLVLLVMFGLLAIVMNIRAKGQREGEEAELTTLPHSMTLTSRSFLAGGNLPLNCTCKGSEQSPALTWESPKPAVQSYVVLAVDYDVPVPQLPLFNLTHWLLYNLPASVRSLPEGITPEQMQMLGGKTGKNSTGNPAYAGPCPSLGRHAYVFRIFALDKVLTFADVPDRFDVQEAIKGHVLDYGEVIGYFP